MRRVHEVLLVSLLLAACGPKDTNGDGIADGIKDPNSISLVAPSTPIGALSGQVLTTRLTPLADAKVSLSIGSRSGDTAPASATSDANGNFFFTGLPAGAQVAATITKDGFATMRATATIPSYAGNFPINDGNAVIGPFTLTQLNGSLKVMVITKSGKPARGAKATVESAPAGTVVSNTSGTYGSSVGVVVADGTVDDQGAVTFSGIAAPEELDRLSGYYDVTVQGYDENGDGTPDFIGSLTRLNANELVWNPAPHVITLQPARSGLPLAISDTNVDSIITPGSPPAKNMVKPGESLYFVFNQPIMDSSLVVRLTDEMGTQSLVISKTLRFGTALSISATTPLEAGKEYNLSVRAISADNGSSLVKAAYFFVADPAAPKPFSVSSIQYKDTNTSGSLTNGETVIFTFNQPITLLSGPPAEAFIDAEFNGTTQGDIMGEKGFDAGFPLVAAEPTNEKNSLFTLQSSGYTTRYEFVLSGATIGVAPTTAVSVSFGKLVTATGGYQTLWGTPITSEESSGVVTAP